MHRQLPLILLALTACGDKDPDTTPQDSDPVLLDDSNAAVAEDLDGDGWTAEAGDCDDQDPDIRPSQPEECDGLDNNCNGEVDEGLPDSDADGTADCLDSEDCDGLDNDGDGLTDEGFDADADGWASCDGDCDDEDAAVSPDATELADSALDEDCDGLVDEGSWAEGDLVITELMVNPRTLPDPDGEWFEVINLSDRDVHLAGLSLSSGGEVHQVTVEGTLVLGAGELFVFGSHGEFEENGGYDAGYVYDGLILDNESDELSLYAGSVLLDSVSWDDGLTMPDPIGASLNLDPAHWDAESNDRAEAWCAAPEPWSADSELGSPGEVNPSCP